MLLLMKTDLYLCYVIPMMFYCIFIYIPKQWFCQYFNILMIYICTHILHIALADSQGDFIFSQMQFISYNLFFIIYFICTYSTQTFCFLIGKIYVSLESVQKSFDLLQMELQCISNVQLKPFLV